MPDCKRGNKRKYCSTFKPFNEKDCNNVIKMKGCEKEIAIFPKPIRIYNRKNCHTYEKKEKLIYSKDHWHEVVVSV